MFPQKIIPAILMLVIALSARAEDAVAPDSSSAAQSSSSVTQPVDEVEEVLVVGAQPGPNLWHVYKDDHELWILGYLSPLPKNMQWRPTKVESVLKESQELLMPPEIKLTLNFFEKVSVLPSLVGIKKNPDGAELKDVLSPELYARWSLLKEKYLGDDKQIEKERPIFAATALFKKAIEKSDLVPADSVRWAVEAIVKQQKIKTTRPIVEQSFQSPRASIKKFKKTALNDEVCFAKTLNRLETDLDAMRARANAWSTGDIQLLIQLPHVDDEAACVDAVLNSDVVRDQGLQDAPDLLRDAWIAAAEAALQTNRSTFAILPMDELLKPHGYLSILQAKGYDVDGGEADIVKK